MKLLRFLKNNNLRISDLAKVCEVRHCVARRWALDENKPSPENMAKIVAYTKGEVTANDFYGIEEKEVINNEQSS